MICPLSQSRASRSKLTEVAGFPKNRSSPGGLDPHNRYRIRRIRSFHHALDMPPVPLYAENMHVNFSPDVETRLQQVAFATGRDAEQIVRDTVNRMLDDQASFVAGVRNGIAQAERGELVEHEDVRRRIGGLFQL